ncbi:MAG: DUF2169 domain-containing protein [Desulfobacterales bacterium]|nr:DUF2169 domain-containing protein [Desulfobacterales bacterium]
MPNEKGVDSAIVVIKTTFNILHDKISVSKNQLPIVKADEYWSNPANSSLKYASEMTLPKPATDIVMIGHAHSPNGKPIYAGYVSLKVGKYTKTLSVFGDRYWKRSFSVYSITDPEPFVKLPLTYEKAFGGVDTHLFDKSKIEYEHRNPVGCGFKVKKGEKEIEGLKLPNIENPGNLINNWKDRPVPTSFGYIAPSWEPRSRFVGTYDEAWQKNRAPYLPEDFDPRFFNCAHPDLITDGYLQGGEDVVIKNASPKGIIKFNLPKIGFEIAFYIDGKEKVGYPNLDTLILEPDDDRFSMIWRVIEECDKKALKIQIIDIRCIESDIDLETGLNNSKNGDNYGT